MNAPADPLLPLPARMTLSKAQTLFGGARQLLLLVALVCGGAGCDGEDGTTGPARTLAGLWDVVGFTEAGVAAAVSGEAEFRADGTFRAEGTITFPGEPPDAIVIEGTYEVTNGSVILTTPDGATTWVLDFSDDQVVLTLNGAPPANTITLRRGAA